MLGWVVGCFVNARMEKWVRLRGFLMSYTVCVFLYGYRYGYVDWMCMWI